LLQPTIFIKWLANIIIADSPGGAVADWYRYAIGIDADFATIPWRGSAGFEKKA